MPTRKLNSNKMANLLGPMPSHTSVASCDSYSKIVCFTGCSCSTIPQLAPWKNGANKPFSVVLEASLLTSLASDLRKGGLDDASEGTHDSLLQRQARTQPLTSPGVQEEEEEEEECIIMRGDAIVPYPCPLPPLIVVCNGEFRQTS